MLAFIVVRVGPVSEVFLLAVVLITSLSLSIIILRGRLPLPRLLRQLYQLVCSSTGILAVIKPVLFCVRCVAVSITLGIFTA